MQTPLRYVSLLILAAVIPLGCSRTVEPIATTLTGETMGTTYTVRLANRPKGVSDKQLKAAIDAALETVNAQMSTYRPDSELSRFNASESTDWFPVSPATVTVVAEALRIGRDAEGVFDVTVMPLVNLWSFGPEARPDKAPTADEIGERRQWVGLDKLEVRTDPPALRKTDPRVTVDLSAIAKGWGVDVVAGVLTARGVGGGHMVEIGGEVVTAGVKADGSPWRIGIEKPLPNARVVERVVELAGDHALASSGDYRNYFEDEGTRYSHTIDPRTGKPINHRLAAVTVFHPACMTADAYATTVMVLGPEAGYNWLVDRNVAALLLIKEGDRFVERMTPLFEQRYAKPSASTR